MLRVFLVITNLSALLIACSSSPTADKSGGSGGHGGVGGADTGGSEVVDAATDSGEDSAVEDSSLAPEDSNAVTDSKCTAKPTKLIDADDLMIAANGPTSISAAMDIAVSATDVYVAVNYYQTGALLRVPIRGGELVTMATVVGMVHELLIVGDSVVFSQIHGDRSGGWSGEIVRVGLQGGDTTVLVSDDSPTYPPLGLRATDGRNLYFMSQDGTNSIPLEGGAVQTLTAHTGSLAVIGSNLVIADSSAAALFSVPIAGGPETTLAENLTGYLRPIVSCGSTICWTSDVPGFIVTSGTGALMQLGPSGEPVTLYEGPELFGVYRLVFDGSDFLAIIAGDASVGSLVSIPSAGGPPVFMGGGADLAIDDECLYTGTISTGVYRVAKSYRGQIP